ncbi:protein RCC2 homolog isoform X1 [Salvia splendens]|uniref:protein RCC2 homolog isoform X1 n=1 Tax=Salvia splendens TaxID=180675 RepID=UPI001C26F4F0|nr:protein RCC2 homolog isoform X1 [Salvia splendens]XP_042031627.1 protein RCC2 homolog isoform X1 [Salvia splendens]XP_042031628.1 protein RCC2 homolog isoform X1 [Salvia splendens]
MLPPNSIISAGAANSACTAGGGQLYIWGKIKNTGDDWMYPKPLMDLSGWNLRCMDSGNSHYFVGADSSCISWGHAQSGELGYGPNGQKSSAIPKKVDILEGMHVISVASGFTHSLIVVDRIKNAERIEELEVHDGKAAEVIEPTDNGADVPEKAPKKSNAKKPQNLKKRKNESSSEDEKNSDYESDGNDALNGSRKSSGQGKGRSPSGKKGRGRGRGRPASEVSSAGGRGTGRRGRPKKS